MMLFVFIVSFLLRSILGDEIHIADSKIAERGKRVIGGTSVDIQTQPWLVSIRHNGLHICGGSILSKSIILTAAHCTTHLISTLSVHVGSSTVKRGSIYAVDRILRHKCYMVTSRHLINDIALLKVMPKLEYNSFVGPIRLAAVGDSIAPGKVASIAGWGHVTQEGDEAEKLMLAQVIIEDSEKCSRVYGDETGKWMATHKLICAGAPGTDSCAGDSGGPLVAQGVQIGIVSYGHGCASLNYSGIYTSVAQHRDWIDGNFNTLDSL